MPLGKLCEDTAEIFYFYANVLKHPLGQVYNIVLNAFIPIYQHCWDQCLPTAPTPLPPATQFCKAWNVFARLYACCHTIECLQKKEEKKYASGVYFKCYMPCIYPSH